MQQRWGVEMSASSDFRSDRGLEPGFMRDVFPSRQDGRKVAAWKFTPSGPGAKPIDVDVFLVGQHALSFSARCNALPQPITGSDIEQLRKDVLEALLEQSSLLSGVEWEDWLEVITEGRDSEFDAWHGWGSAIHIQVNRIKRGVDSASGRELTINARGYVVDFPRPAKLGGSESRSIGGLGEYTKRTPERAYVPDTPAVRAALEDVFSRMRALRGRLAEALSHDGIGTALEGGALPWLGEGGEAAPDAGE